MAAGVRKLAGHRIQTNMYIPKSFMKLLTSLLTSLLALLFAAVTPVAIAYASSVAQGYQSKQTIAAGAIVSLTKSGSNEVEVTDKSNESLMLGVAVDSKNAIVDLQ